MLRAGSTDANAIAQYPPWTRISTQSQGAYGAHPWALTPMASPLPLVLHRQIFHFFFFLHFSIPSGLRLHYHTVARIHLP